MSTTTRSRDRRAEHLRNLRDHPSTSAEERAAAEEALRRLGADESERTRWRRGFDERIIGIELQLIEAEHAARMARIDEDHARRVRERHESVVADLREQLAHQQAWRETVA